MELQTTLFLLLASILRTVHSQGGPRGVDWGWNVDWDFAPECARSCLSSAYPTTSTISWGAPCSTPSGLSNCVNSACTITATASAYSSLTSVQASLCSVYSSYSSCTSASSSCTWPYTSPFSPWDRHNGSRPQGWVGPGSQGWYTYTCTDGRSSGWSTATLTVTSTSTGTAGTSVLTNVIKETATLVAAAAAASGTTSGASSTATGSSGTKNGEVHVLGMGVVLAVGVGAMAML
ncbi:uncharacterized protein PAC_12923 [Phialocephala subalpina]|uniref:Extracellular membrane protein CFEM domain-containing protein n=1 Tax=Phialocephala subalpina TaxID=576137 RepID=A0A1L7XDF9_9HELO|nr:uncharacterized protein PAC_12923 [Phialocephala subalpina]